MESQHVIHVAAAGWPASITVKAGTGEIGAARNHRCLIDHQKFVAHQAAAAAPVFGVVNQWNLRGLKERHGISAEGFLRTRAAIPIAVGQAVQLIPMLSFSLVQAAGPLFAPGVAIAVLQHHGNASDSLFCRDQGPGNPRKTELLYCTSTSSLAESMALISHCSESSPLRQAQVRGER